MSIQGVNIYGALAVIAILLSAFMWSRMAKRDARLTIIYFGGLFGALIGAHLAFLFAEVWLHLNDWRVLLSGRSITGGLLGGYAAVELAKARLNYRRATGDYFAVLVPLALVLGRVGCAVQGCCAGRVCEAQWWTLIDAQGMSRWPARYVELAFNVLFLLWALGASRMNWLPGNRFHVYLIAYGVFRFLHEFMRETPEIALGVSGYQIIAMLMAILGAVRFAQRGSSLRELRMPAQQYTAESPCP